ADCRRPQNASPAGRAGSGKRIAGPGDSSVAGPISGASLSGIAGESRIWSANSRSSMSILRDAIDRRVALGNVGIEPVLHDVGVFRRIGIMAAQHAHGAKSLRLVEQLDRQVRLANL